MAYPSCLAIQCLAGPSLCPVDLLEPDLPIIWTPAATNSAATDGAFSFFDLIVTNDPQRFYEIRSQ